MHIGSPAIHHQAGLARLLLNTEETHILRGLIEPEVHHRSTSQPTEEACVGGGAVADARVEVWFSWHSISLQTRLDIFGQGIATKLLNEIAASIPVQCSQFDRRSPKIGQGQVGEVERFDLGGLSLLVDRSTAKLPKGFSR